MGIPGNGYSRHQGAKPLVCAALYGEAASTQHRASYGASTPGRRNWCGWGWPYQVPDRGEYDRPPCGEPFLAPADGN